MNKTARKIPAMLATVGITAALLVGGSTSANAINRWSCGSQYLNLVSTSTTCWANAGYASVTLYGVYSISSGNNAGYVQGSNGTTYFSKWQAKSIPTQTISGIRIY
ncbi:hypothetical protein I6E68_13880 [Salinibacterium sp. NSLL150]|nr:hypothetical protein [Salinibacterium sp. NSLL150]MBH0105742.1 hypothetical protein [Salinibacterium sp. NSLL16]MBH0108502.1 hypothetical protein [Salinibacterium sp. NSLL17]